MAWLNVSLRDTVLSAHSILFQYYSSPSPQYPGGGGPLIGGPPGGGGPPIGPRGPPGGGGGPRLGMLPGGGGIPPGGGGIAPGGGGIPPGGIAPGGGGGIPPGPLGGIGGRPGNKHRRKQICCKLTNKLTRIVLMDR